MITIIIIIITIIIIIIIIIIMALPRQLFHRVALHPPGGPTALRPCPRTAFIAGSYILTIFSLLPQSKGKQGLLKV